MLRTAALALIALLAAASLAAAQDTPPTPEGPRAGCKPRLALVLRGRFLAGGTTSFQMNVRGAGRGGRALRGPRELLIDSKTRFRRQGRPAALAALQSDDRLHVLVRACRSGSATRLELVARSVFARPAL
jgi:hypothetical protein